MLRNYDNVNGLKGYVDFREKQAFLQGSARSLIVYKYNRAGLTPFTSQSPRITVEDNGTFWVVRKI